MTDSNNTEITTSLELIDFTKNLEQLLANRTQTLKLIIHVGTPKTGTTSVQDYLHRKQRKLHAKGILYPNRSHNPNAPKHQWFEKNLVRTHPQHLLDNFKNILNDVEQHTHTILLSSEGFYNHWWDFPAESKALLLIISKLFEVNIWLWFRQPLEFAESFYKQCLRNPSVDNISCYGKDLSFAEMLKDPWFNQHLDYMGFVNEVDALFGKTAVSVFEYQQDTVQQVSKLLGLATPHDNPTPRKNNSMNASTAELYRVINRLQLTAKDKEKLVPHLQDLDAVLTSFAPKDNQSLIDNESKAKINKMTAKGILELRKRSINT